MAFSNNTPTTVITMASEFDSDRVDSVGGSSALKRLLDLGEYVNLENENVD
jgi:hypothetical protein